MARFKLKAGGHTGADRSKKPDASGRYPTKSYKIGQVIESDVDLVAFGGAEKFELISGSPIKTAQNKRAKSFPGGQVHDGLQETRTDERGNQVTGPMEEDDDGDENEGLAEDEEQNQQMSEDEEEENLSSMTVPELRKIAKKKGIDLTGVHLKEEIVETIRQHESE